MGGGYFAAVAGAQKRDLNSPVFGEKIPWGLESYLQALLLAWYLRGDLEAYPPFFVEVRMLCWY